MNDGKSLRVLHVAETIIGGVSSYLQEVVAFQSDALGADNIRLLVPGDHAHELVGVDEQMIVGYPRSGRNVRSFLAFSRALHHALDDFDPSIVHLHSSFAGAVGRPIALLRRRRPRVVYCAHGWAFLMDIPAWKRQAYAVIERALCRYTDVVVNISRYEDQQAKVYGISPEKCVVVRNAISPNPSQECATNPFGGDSINLLFVGRLDRQKGLDLLLRVMARVQDLPIHLYVIGARVRDGSAVAPPPNVTMLGWLPRRELDAYYAAADAVVMPSRWEGFGLVAIEAMRNGTAVIVSDRGALPELVEHDQTGYVFSLDEGDLSPFEHVLRVLDKSRLKTLGDAAAQHFKQFFTSEIMNRGLLDVYCSLQKPRSRGEAQMWLSRGDLW
jgi:glycosyltransferase involved in cell wall biosynthesis